jgi:hypothetical protein
MLKPLLIAAATCALVSCDPFEPLPYFTPNPPYPPRRVDPYRNDASRHRDYRRNPYEDRAAYDNQDRPVNPSPAPAPAPGPDYPTAKRTANPNQVISPYEPYNVIDVEGFRSGQLARDPSNQKIFRVP